MECDDCEIKKELAEARKLLEQWRRCGRYQMASLKYPKQQNDFLERIPVDEGKFVIGSQVEA